MAPPRLTLAHRAIASRLLDCKGKATAEELRSQYPHIEPLIRCKYVTVVNDNGIPIYVLTEEGTRWAEKSEN